MKQFKKSLLIIGLCFLMIGCTNDAMGKVTKKLQDAGYDISYLTDDFTAVNITKTEKDKDRIQFCAYLEKKVVTSISYIVLPDQKFLTKWSFSKEPDPLSPIHFHPHPGSALPHEAHNNFHH